jgi:hypothetical protein
MTEEQRMQLRKFKTGMRTIATMMANNLIGFRSVAIGEPDLRLRAAYQAMVRRAPALIAECRALATEAEAALRNDCLPENDEWRSLLNRSRRVSYEFGAIHEELELSGDGVR